MDGGNRILTKPEAIGIPKGPANKKIRVLVADDHEVVLCGLSALLNTSANCEVVGVASTGKQALTEASRTRPDVAVLDINMPVLNGVEATREIRRTHPRTEVLILTGFESEQLAYAILHAGARGYLLKTDSERELILAVESLAKGRPYFTTSLARAILDGYIRTQSQTDNVTKFGSGLTPCERKIVQLLAEGYSNKEVASLQGITVKTAETHRANIMRKLRLRSVPDLVHYAVRNQIISI